MIPELSNDEKLEQAKKDGRGAAWVSTDISGGDRLLLHCAGLTVRVMEHLDPGSVFVVNEAMLDPWFTRREP